ncbi:MAG: hypothetical protein U0670_12575 [Anaerolineae bacterium]
MPEANVFRWIEGRGWIVLSGRLSDVHGDAGDIRSLVLARSAADGGVACVSLSGDPQGAEKLLEDLESLGAPAGFIVDVFSEDDNTIQKRLADAGVIVIDSAPDAESARSALLGAPIDGIQEAFVNGAIVLLEGNSLSPFGSWLIKNDGSVVGGAKWLDSAVILPSATQLAMQVREVFELEPAAYALGIADGSALALGPDGEVQVWGRGQVAVALGSTYTTQDDARDASKEE